MTLMSLAWAFHPHPLPMGSISAQAHAFRCWPGCVLCVPVCSSITAMLVAGWELRWSRTWPTNWLVAWPGSCLVAVGLQLCCVWCWLCSLDLILTSQLDCGLALLLWRIWILNLTTMPALALLALLRYCGVGHCLLALLLPSAPCSSSFLIPERLRKASHHQPCQHKISPVPLSKKNWLWWTTSRGDSAPRQLGVMMFVF